jgi:hypothetical protein
MGEAIQSVVTARDRCLLHCIADRTQTESVFRQRPVLRRNLYPAFTEQRPQYREKGRKPLSGNGLSGLSPRGL